MKFAYFSADPWKILRSQRVRVDPYTHVRLAFTTLQFAAALTLIRNWTCIFHDTEARRYVYADQLVSECR